ncbi:H-NS histone family protein [Cupriavidus sp. EM10]|uniref:H-NS histone family protein n=1 Tax=Cupriavidus sp. EM10 TaxID=2839983 RepID=UPI001CEDA2F6|nr:H-NS histone family protein [Cupriavidus sp. EM10]
MHAPHEIARADAIRWVRIKMAQSGLTLADLLAAGCFAPTAARPRYRKMPRANLGWARERPDWFQRAINAGQQPEFFQID